MYGTQRPIFPQNGSIYHFSTCKNMAWTTDYGRMMAISQILFGQYHIWVGVWKAQFFCWKNSWMMEITDKGLSAKMGADILPENTPNTPKFILPICPIGPKVWDAVEKRLHWVSVVRGLNGASSVLLHLIIRGSNDAEETFRNWILYARMAFP